MQRVWAVFEMAFRDFMVPQKTVALLFVSGTTLPHQDGTFTTIRGAEDIPEWMSVFQEIQMLAHVEPFFIANDGDHLQSVWARTIQTIAELRGACDAVVILHGDDQLTLTSSALTFGMPNIHDTIVIGSLRMRPGMVIPRRDEQSLDPQSYFSIQSNIINLVRASLLPIHTIAMVDEHRILRANRITADPETHYILPLSEDALLGTMDLLVDFHQPRYKSDAHVIFDPGFSDRVAVQTIEELSKTGLSRDADAVIIDARTEIRSRSQYGQVLRRLHHPQSLLVSPSSILFINAHNELSSTHLTFESAVAKSMWMIQHELFERAFFKQLVHPIAGEIFA